MTEPVSDTDAKLLRKFGGKYLVMTIVFTIAVGLLIVIIVKRQILRMILISRRGPHTTIGTDAPRPLARQIDSQLKRISYLRIEPRLMSEQFNKPPDESNFDSPPDQYTRSYKYRMKAMDKMGELDDLVCSVSHKYNRRKGQTVRKYLKMLQHHQVIKKGDDTIDKLADMYEHARFEPKEFGNIQYRKFAYLVEQLKDRVRLYVNVPGSLIINSTNRQPKKKRVSSARIPSSDIISTEKPDNIGPVPVAGPSQAQQPENEEPGLGKDTVEFRSGTEEGTNPTVTIATEGTGGTVLTQTVVIDERCHKMSDSGAAIL